MSSCEEDPLLNRQDHHFTNDDIDPDTELYRENSVTTRSESRFIVRSSIPLIVTFFLQYLISVTSIYAAGRLGPKELAASSLSICTFTITGLAIYQGMATSLDSFCSQAYGSGQLHNVGIYFQRCCLMMLTITIFPLSFIWWFSGSILKFLISDSELVNMTQTFLRILMLSAPPLFLFEAGKRFLQAQHIFNASTQIILIAAPLNICLNWLLVWNPSTGIGFIGAPIAIVIIYWFIAILLFLYVLLVDGKQCWGGLSLTKATSNWIPLLKLAIPGIIMVEAEYLAFEVLTILSASFGTETLAAQSIASNVGTMAFQFPFAVSVAITTRIGHFVGMKNIKAGKLVIKLSIFTGFIISIMNFSIVFFGRKFWSSFFTNSEEVKSISNKVLVLVALNQISDSMNVLGAGILRGFGRQRIGSILSIVSYYIIALPIGYTLSFVFEMQLYGLWLGLIAGVIFLAISEAICIYNSDWNKILQESSDSHDS